MSKVKFKFQADVKAKCRVTGFEGTIVCRSEEINGAIKYGLQPPCEKGFLPDCKGLDEAILSLIDAEPIEEEVEFKFENGQKVKNYINGFEGIVINREVWMNGCIKYDVEAPIHSGPEGIKRVAKQAWEQELEAVPEKVSKVDKVKGAAKRTGGPISTMSQERGE